MLPMLGFLNRFFPDQHTHKIALFLSAPPPKGWAKCAYEAPHALGPSLSFHGGPSSLWQKGHAMQSGPASWVFGDAAP